MYANIKVLLNAINRALSLELHPNKWVWKEKTTQVSLIPVNYPANMWGFQTQMNDSNYLEFGGGNWRFP